VVNTLFKGEMMNMKRNFLLVLPLAVMLLLLAVCSQSAAREIDTAGWVDIGGLKIPPAWSFSEGEPDSWDITGEGAGGSIRMFLGYGLSGPIEALIEESISSQAFLFDDGQSGYMLEFPQAIAWTRESRTKDLLLYHDGDRSVFADNEDLILRIARTLAEDQDPVSELGSRIDQKYPDLDAIKAQFGVQAKWVETTEPNLHEPEFNMIIRTMGSPGIDIQTLEIPQHDRFFITGIVVKSSGTQDFLGIYTGSSREDVITTFGDPHEIGDNKLIYRSECEFREVRFTIENNRVAEMIYLLFVD